MKKLLFLLSFLMFPSIWAQEITLNHNIGSTIIDQTGNFACTGGGVKWARIFDLEEFGVIEGFTLESGSFGIEYAGTAPGAGIRFRIYVIDDGFPETFDEAIFLGQGPQINLPSLSSNTIFDFNFGTSIVIPAGAERILVQARQAYGSQIVRMGGTSNSDDFSWILTNPGCITADGLYQTTVDWGRPNLNYYITVTGTNPILGVDQNNLDQIIVAPNPANDVLKINAINNYQDLTLEIYNLNGSLILKDQAVEQLDVSALSSGLYFLKISSPEASVIKKFFKQ